MAKGISLNIIACEYLLLLKDERIHISLKFCFDALYTIYIIRYFGFALEISLTPTHIEKKLCPVAP